MRGFYWRGVKYEIKMGNPSLGAVFTGNVDRMASQWRQKSTPFYFLDAKVRGYLLDNSIKTILFPFYLSFGRKALMLFQEYKGRALTERINELIDIFKGYGLQESHLKNIITNVLHQTPPIS